MTTPSVSVVMPAYNRAAVIGRAMRSVSKQTLPAHEIIVVDDGSTDNTVEAALAVAPQCRVVRSDTNRGAQAARAEGIRAATGEWIAFLDSDDWWLPQKLEWQMEKAKEGFDVIHGGALEQRNGRKRVYRIPRMEGEIYADLLAHPGPMFQCLLVRRRCFDKAGFPDPAIRAYQEWDTSLLLARHYAFGFVDKPLFVYEIQKDSISADEYRNLYGYEQVVTKWWKEILRVAGAKAGYRHYRVMAQYSRPLTGLAGEMHYRFLGARLTGLSRGRAMGDMVANRLSSPQERLRSALSSVARRIPGLRTLYRTMTGAPRVTPTPGRVR